MVEKPAEFILKVEPVPHEHKPGEWQYRVTLKRDDGAEASELICGGLAAIDYVSSRLKRELKKELER